MSEKSAMYNAHNAVSVARRDGAIKAMPCEKCGNPEALAHHEDYAKPLEITWLCRSCHSRRHKELGWGMPRQTPGVLTSKGSSFDRTSISLPPYLLKIAQEMARKDNRSLSSFIAQLIADKAQQ